MELQRSLRVVETELKELREEMQKKNLEVCPPPPPGPAACGGRGGQGKGRREVARGQRAPPPPPPSPCHGPAFWGGGLPQANGSRGSLAAQSRSHPQALPRPWTPQGPRPPPVPIGVPQGTGRPSMCRCERPGPGAGRAHGPRPPDRDRRRTGPSPRWPDRTAITRGRARGPAVGPRGRHKTEAVLCAAPRARVTEISAGPVAGQGPPWHRLGGMAGHTPGPDPALHMPCPPPIPRQHITSGRAATPPPPTAGPKPHRTTHCSARPQAPRSPRRTAPAARPSVGGGPALVRCAR